MVAFEMSNDKYDRALQSRIAMMYSNLKIYGAQLEHEYKELLDRFVIKMVIPSSS